MSALRSYSRDNQGWFPDGGRTGVAALIQLYPDYAKARLLSGISGSERKTQRSLSSKGNLDEQASSWIYWPGFREDDDPQIAIIWEKEEGIGFNGHRSTGHAVGLIDGSHQQVSADKWESFLKDQAERRADALRKRRR